MLYAKVNIKDTDTREALGELIDARLAVAKVEKKTLASFKEIKFIDSTHENLINKHIAEVQEYAYIAGFKDAILLAAGFGINE